MEGGASSTGVNSGGEPVGRIRSLKANVSVNAKANAKSTSRVDSPKAPSWRGGGAGTSQKASVAGSVNDTGPDNVRANIQVNANERLNADADVNGYRQFRLR